MMIKLILIKCYLSLLLISCETKMTKFKEIDDDRHDNGKFLVNSNGNLNLLTMGLMEDGRILLIITQDSYLMILKRHKALKPRILRLYLCGRFKPMVKVWPKLYETPAFQKILNSTHYGVIQKDQLGWFVKFRSPTLTVIYYPKHDLVNVTNLKINNGVQQSTKNGGNLAKNLMIVGHVSTIREGSNIEFRSIIDDNGNHHHQMSYNGTVYDVCLELLGNIFPKIVFWRPLFSPSSQLPGAIAPTTNCTTFDYRHPINFGFQTENQLYLFTLTGDVFTIQNLTDDNLAPGRQFDIYRKSVAYYFVANVAKTFHRYNNFKKYFRCILYSYLATCILVAIGAIFILLFIIIKDIRNRNSSDNFGGTKTWFGIY